MIDWNLGNGKKKLETIYFILQEFESGYRRVTIKETGYSKRYKIHEEYGAAWEAWRLGLSLTNADILDNERVQNDD